MAATADLAAVTRFALERGASVRLVGDDRQLASVAAGGVLRDIQATVGAVTLTELVRFRDQAEAAAGLAIRAGDTTGLGFYIDNDRVHVGDLTTVTDHAYTPGPPTAPPAWTRSCSPPPASWPPTQRPRPHRPPRSRRGRTRRRPPDRVRISRRHASRGDSGRRVSGLRRRHDHHPPQRPHAAHQRHRLRQERRPVDRHQAHTRGKHAAPWTSCTSTPAGTSACPPTTSRSTSSSATPPPCTAPKASPPTPPTPSPPATESRQQLYVALTRGRAGQPRVPQRRLDGDEHSVITPAATHPLTALNMLEQILARDEAQPSATTTARPLDRPRHRAAAATARYLDSLHTAAADLLGPGWPTASTPPRPAAPRDHRLPRLAHPARPPGPARRRPGRTRPPRSPQPCTRGRSTPPPTSPPSWTGAWTPPTPAAPAPDPLRGSPASPHRCARPVLGPLPDRPPAPGRPTTAGPSATPPPSDRRRPPPAGPGSC